MECYKAKLLQTWWIASISLQNAAQKSRKDAKEVVFCPGPRGFVRGAGVGRARPGNP